MPLRHPARRRLAVGVALLCAVAPGACSDDPDGPAATSTTTTTEAPPGDGQIAVTELATLDWPTDVAMRPGDDRLYVAQQQGLVQVLEPDGAGGYTVRDQPFLDLTAEMGRPDLGSEAGLHGITFSPDGTRLFLSDTQYLPKPEPGQLPFLKRVMDFEVDGDSVDLASRRVLIALGKLKSNHNGGDLVFGPDGFLYISIGDGSDGGAGDRRNTGQDPSDLFGGILRIDPLSVTDPAADPPYAIPSDNPFVDGGGAPEVWIYGARNPYRFSFDAENGDLWVGDVGEKLREEIDLLPEGTAAGANLGWSTVEGTVPFEGRTPAPDAVLPVHEYNHDEGCAVTGGFRYRGSAVSPLRGAYLYSDYCFRELRTLVKRDGQIVEGRSFGTLPKPVLSFGETADREILVLTADRLYRIDPG